MKRNGIGFLLLLSLAAVPFKAGAATAEEARQAEERQRQAAPKQREIMKNTIEKNFGGMIDLKNEGPKVSATHDGAGSTSRGGLDVIIPKEEGGKVTVSERASRKGMPKQSDESPQNDDGRVTPGAFRSSVWEKNPDGTPANYDPNNGNITRRVPDIKKNKEPEPSNNIFIGLKQSLNSAAESLKEIYEKYKRKREIAAEERKLKQEEAKRAKAEAEKPAVKSAAPVASNSCGAESGENDASIMISMGTGDSRYRHSEAQYKRCYGKNSAYRNAYDGYERQRMCRRDVGMNEGYNRAYSNAEPAYYSKCEGTSEYKSGWDEGFAKGADTYCGGYQHAYQSGRGVAAGELKMNDVGRWCWKWSAIYRQGYDDGYNQMAAAIHEQQREDEEARRRAEKREVTKSVLLGILSVGETAVTAYQARDAAREKEAREYRERQAANQPSVSYSGEQETFVRHLGARSSSGGGAVDRSGCAQGHWSGPECN